MPKGKEPTRNPEPEIEAAEESSGSSSDKNVKKPKANEKTRKGQEKEEQEGAKEEDDEEKEEGSGDAEGGEEQEGAEEEEYEYYESDSDQRAGFSEDEDVGCSDIEETPRYETGTEDEVPSSSRGSARQPSSARLPSSGRKKPRLAQTQPTEPRSRASILRQSQELQKVSQRVLKPTPRSKTLPQRKTITDEYSPRSQFSTPRESEQEYPEQEEEEEEEEEEDYEEEIDDPRSYEQMIRDAKRPSSRPISKSLGNSLRNAPPSRSVQTPAKRTPAPTSMPPSRMRATMPAMTMTHVQRDSPKTRCRRAFIRWLISRKKPSLWYMKVFGPIPSGYRPSTLAALVKRGKATPSSAILPTMEESCVTFSDLQLDMRSQQLRTANYRAEFKVSVGSVRNIPTIGAGAEIVARRVRICLWDAVNGVPLSNCHTITGQHLEGNKYFDSWRFKSKQGWWMERHGENTFLVRTNLQPDPRANVRNVQAFKPTVAELSCRWASLRLFDHGQLINLNKSYSLDLHGGTPQDDDVDLEPSDALPGTYSNFLLSILAEKVKIERAYASIRMSELSRSEKIDIGLLPSTIITSLSTIALLIQYRILLFNTLVKPDAPRTFMQTSAVCDPVLSVFQRILNDAPLLDAVKYLWGVGYEKLTRKERVIGSIAQQQLFRGTILHLWPLLHSLQFPSDPLIIADPVQLARRKAMIEACITTSPDVATIKNPASLMYAPFDVSEVTYQSPLPQT